MNKDVEQKNEAGNIETEDTLTEQSAEIESSMSENIETNRFDNAKQNDVIKDQKGKNIKLIKYILGVLLIAVLALGMFFVSSLFSKNSENEPEKTENHQTPNKKQKRGHHSGEIGQNSSSQQSPDKPNDSSTPSKPNSGNGANFVNSTVPNKIHNALSSQASQLGGNGNVETTGHVNSTVGNNHNNISAVDINPVSQHGEDVVSSDQQATIDAANNGKKKQIIP